jgi:hypothetical protein
MWEVGELSNFTRQACSSNDGTEVLLELLGISLAQCGPQRVIQIRLLPRAPARIKSFRDCDAAVAKGLRDRPNIDARLQQFDRVRVPEVVRTAIYTCLLESLPVEFLEI